MLFSCSCHPRSLYIFILYLGLLEIALCNLNAGEHYVLQLTDCRGFFKIVKFSGKRNYGVFCFTVTMFRLFPKMVKSSNCIRFWSFTYWFSCYTNTKALNSFEFAPVTLPLSLLGRGRGEGGELNQMSKLFLRLYQF